MKNREKRVKAAELVKQCRALADKDGGMAAEDKAEYDKLWAAYGDLKDEIDRADKAEQADKAMENSMGAFVDDVRRVNDTPAAPIKVKMGQHEIEIDERHPLYASSTPEAVKAFDNYLRSGKPSAALQKDSDPAGGYTVPAQFAARLIQALDNVVFMRQIGTVLPPLTVGGSIGVPSLDADPADPTWVAEISTGAEDSTMSFGKREMRPHPLAQLIKVSKTLVRQSALPIEAIVRERLLYKLSVVEENAFLNGSGAAQPLGVFTASSSGISTSRDVSTGNSTTAIGADNLREVKYSLARQYRGPSLRWVFHRDAVKMISKLKDGNGQYLWSPGIAGQMEDTILNVPVIESEYAPNTFTTALYVGILGDFSQYWIIDSLGATIDVASELYMATNQNGYFSRTETDGAPVLEAAFARVKLA
jgi:HK97 family phage major capsid protein